MLTRHPFSDVPLWHVTNFKLILCPTRAIPLIQDPMLPVNQVFLLVNLFELMFFYGLGLLLLTLFDNVIELMGYFL